MTWRDHLTAFELADYERCQRLAGYAREEAKIYTEDARKIYDRVRKRAAKEKPNAD
jgi:hypothetical protein